MGVTMIRPVMGYRVTPVAVFYAHKLGKPAWKFVHIKSPDTITLLPWASQQIRKFRVAHAPGMPGTFPPPPTSMETAS